MVDHYLKILKMVKLSPKARFEVVRLPFKVCLKVIYEIVWLPLAYFLAVLEQLQTLTLVELF